MPRPRTRDPRLPIAGWALYDWASSAFVTTVVAGFFPVFFKEFWSRGVDTTLSTARLGLANSVAGIIVALSAPLLGAIADAGQARTRFLLAFAALGASLTAWLSFTAPGAWQKAALLYVGACAAFAAANVFYDSLLPCVAQKGSHAAVSALGFALGYLGGGLLLALNVAMVSRPDSFGLRDANQAVRGSFLMVAAWWAAFSLPLALFVREGRTSGSPRGLPLRRGLTEVVHTLRRGRQLKPLALFLLAYWLYIDGVDTVVRMAVDYGLSIGFSAHHLLLALLLTQFVGFPCALAFGSLGHRIGSTRAILIGLGVYLVVCAWGASMRHTWEFFVLAFLIGTVQGGVQALSRAVFAGLVPPEHAAEFFGFYNMVGKFATVMGPSLMGLVALGARACGLAPDTASRVSIASVALLFLAGGALLASLRLPSPPPASSHDA